MKPRRLFTSIALAGICWLLTSCIDTKEPLSSPEQAKVDKELIGAWRAKFKDGTIDYYHIAPAGGKLPPRLLDPIDQLPLGTGLPKVQLKAGLGGFLVAEHLDVRQCRRAVDVRSLAAEQVEVGPVENHHRPHAA